MSDCARQLNESGHVAFNGVLTRASVPDIWKQRKQWLQGEQALTFDLQQLEKIDSAGVAMLLEVKRELRAQQRDLVIKNANQQLTAMIRVSGVDTLLELA